MNKRTISERLAVCSWSLQPATPQELVAKLRTTGIHRVQLALDPLRESPDIWGETSALFQQADIALASGMFGCLGEDYSTLESIRLTGGIAPDATWEHNQENFQATATLAETLKLRLVTFHAGFLPHEKTDPNFEKMLRRLRNVADLFLSHRLTLGLETGQESAPVLLGLLQSLERPNVRVNFDPANMLLYDKGDPVSALQVLGPWIAKCTSKMPGVLGCPAPGARRSQSAPVRLIGRIFSAY